LIRKNEEIVGEQQLEQFQELIPKIYQRRYCETCHLYRPPLASHCKYCD